MLRARVRSAIRELLENPVFRLVMLGRYGRFGRISIPLIVLAEVAVLVWIASRFGEPGKLMEALHIMVGIHMVAAPMILLGAIPAMSRPFSVAQKQDLWLTRLSSREILAGVLVPAVIMTFVVIVVVPILLVMIGVMLNFPDALFLLASFLDALTLPGDFFDWYGPSSLIGYVGLYSCSLIAYLTVSLFVTRVLVGALVSSRAPFWLNIIRSIVQGSVLALLITILYVQVLISINEFFYSRGDDLLVLLASGGFALLILSTTCLATFSHAKSVNHQLWFREALPDLEEVSPWRLGTSESSDIPLCVRLATAGQVIRRLLPFTPRYVLCAAIGSAVALGLFAYSEILNEPDLQRWNQRTFAPRVATHALGATLAGLLAFRATGRFAWAAAPPLIRGSLGVMIGWTVFVTATTTTVLLFGTMSLATLWTSPSVLLSPTIAIGFTAALLLVSMLHLTIFCLLRLPSTRRMVCICILASCTSLGSSLFFIQADVWRALHAIGLIVPVAFATFWMMGGGRYLIRRLHEEGLTIDEAPSQPARVESGS